MSEKRLPTTQEDIRVGYLKVDPAYQRDLNMARAKLMALNWSDEKSGNPQVSRRMDGSYYLIDGQHRRAACELANGPDKKLACKVHHGLTLAEEAEIFYATNKDVVKPRPTDNFRAALVAGHMAETQVNNVLAELNLSVGKAASTNVVGAVTAVMRIYDQIGDDGLFNTLSVLIAAWGREATTWDADMMQAVARLIHDAPDLDYVMLPKVLSKDGRKVRTVDDWKRAGMTMKKAGGSTSRSFAIAQLISWAYNKKFEKQPAKKIDLTP